MSAELIARVLADLETVTAVCSVGQNHPIGCGARSEGVFWCDCGFTDAVTRLNTGVSTAVETLTAERDALGIVETCDGGHRFVALTDHPSRDGLRRCPYCMAVGLDHARAERDAARHALANAEIEADMSESEADGVIARLYAERAALRERLVEAVEDLTGYEPNVADGGLSIVTTPNGSLLLRSHVTSIIKEAK